MSHRPRVPRAIRAAALSVALTSGAPSALAVPLSHFDYTSFETGFGQSHFNILNYPGLDLRYMMTSTDNHRPEMVTNGNALAQFYNNFNADYNHPDSERRTPVEEADFIHQYTLNNSTNNGPRPTWLILNEISASQWQLNPGAPSLSTHRTWVIDTVTRLHDVYGYNVITYSPYQTVGTANGPSWQALAEKSYIGIEAYLSGPEVMGGGSDYASRVAYAQGQYQNAKNTYMAAGVPADKLFVSEHFGSTNATFSGGTVTWGRAGLASASDWDQVIMIRQDAMKNVGFAGFLAYNHGGNGMGITQAEQLQHLYHYRSRLVLPGQQPQWLSDSSINVNGTVIPLSWGQFLNWIGGVPNASGAVANFYKTITTNRSITLDGNKTVDTLTFNSNFTYTINPGTGGSLTMQNATATAPIVLTLGHANITVPINLIDPINVTVTPAASNLTFAGGITNNGGKSITKEGLGTLHISGAQSHANFSSLSVNQGTVVLNSDAGSAALKTLGVNVTGRLTMNSSQHLANLTVNNSGNATLTAHGARILHTRGLSLAPTAKLDLNNNDLIVDYTGSSPFSTIFNWVLQGYSESPDVSKTGIISTTAQNVSGASPILALFDNALVGASDWLGNPIPNNAIVGKYTYFGDANFDGQVTGDDYTVIDANLNTDPAAGLEWLSGDMNLDGSITGDDYTVIDANLGNGVGNPLSSAQLSSVPEPVAIVFLPAGLLLTRRRRI